MAELTVRQLAESTGITIRTLRYYDKIGLLVPGRQAGSNYRTYNAKDCLRLQQILIYRELEVPLGIIRELLDNEPHDAAGTLRKHADALGRKRQRITNILHTVERTIEALEQKGKIMDYKDLYEGFGAENAEVYREEARERWGEIAERSEEKLTKLSRNEWKMLINEGEAITRELAMRSHLPPDEASVQDWIAKHFRHIGRHFEVTKEIYSNMGKMYEEDERFRFYYERFSPGMAAFMNRAIRHFCNG
jgi:MerR family transcriptional regulator, thiopeptide resistance regulator